MASDGEFVVEEDVAEVADKTPKKFDGHHSKNSISRDKISTIRNKVRRGEIYAKFKREKSKADRLERKKRKAEYAALGDNAPPKKVPRTIENTREPDFTSVNEEDEEVTCDIVQDELEAYFSKSYEPKVLITSSDNVHRKTICFMRELRRMIPNSIMKRRKRSRVKEMVKSATERGYTDILIVNEDHRHPTGLLVIHLPDGPTALFKLSNVKVTKDLKLNWREISSHRPEVLMNNFSTRLGHSIGRMLAALFHYEPEFRGRRVVTFHNQRDYIFIRHHRYEFKSNEKVSLKELGPRFTLKLRSLQKGTFDSKYGDYEWLITGRRHEMETTRRRFFL